jgi:hypothetical protein
MHTLAPRPAIAASLASEDRLCTSTADTTPSHSSSDKRLKSPAGPLGAIAVAACCHQSPQHQPHQLLFELVNIHMLQRHNSYQAQNKRPCFHRHLHCN